MSLFWSKILQWFWDKVKNRNNVNVFDITNKTFGAEITFLLEARLDENGYPKLYKLPKNDGGGDYEIAGINSKYHPEALDKIKKTSPRYRKFECIKYIDYYTRRHTKLIIKNKGLEIAILDATFNRGGGGCCRITQMALKSLGLEIEVDGKWGRETQAIFSLAEKEISFCLLKALRKQREAYELEEIGYRKNLFKGLKNRWDEIYNISKKFV